MLKKFFDWKLILLSILGLNSTYHANESKEIAAPETKVKVVKAEKTNQTQQHSALSIKTSEKNIDIKKKKAVSNNTNDISIIPNVLAKIGTSVITEKTIEDFSLLNNILNKTDKHDFNLPKQQKAYLLIELIKQFTKFSIIKMFFNIKSESVIPESLFINKAANLEKRFKLPKGSFYEKVKEYKINPRTVKIFMLVQEQWPIFVKSNNRHLLTVSPHEIDEKLLINASKSIKQNYYHLFEVFLPFYSLPSTLQETQQHLKEFSEFIRSDKGKKSISQVAYVYSSAPSSAIGGNLGWLTEKTLPARLKLRLSKLNKDNVIGPMREKNGFRFYYVKDTTNTLSKTINDKSDIYSFIELTYIPPKDCDQSSLYKTNQEIVLKLANIDTIEKARILKEVEKNKVTIKISENKEIESLGIDVLEQISPLNTYYPTSAPIIQDGIVKIYHLISHISSKNKDFLRKKIMLEVQNHKLNMAFAIEDQSLWAYSKIEVTEKGKKILEIVK